MSSLRLGILVDSLSKQQSLTSMIAQAGHSIAFRALVSIAPEDLPDLDRAVDAWIVDSASDSTADSEVLGENPDVQANAALDFLLENTKVPVILSDSSDCVPGSEAHAAWLRRMTQRLEHLSGEVNLQQMPRATSVWVLAASTGGPAAVKEFLAELPGDLGLAFVYVQHIDSHYTTTLVRMMNAAGRYAAGLASHGAVLQPDSLVLVTAERRVDILDNGTLALTREPWGGRYAPSIDQVVANVARTYRERAGLIVFTGMGDDGAASSRLIKQQGGQVWAQSPASCTSPSMPESALATNCVSYQGTPVELARQLTQHIYRTTNQRKAL